MFEFPSDWILLLLDASIKTLMLWGMAWVAVRLFQLSDSNLRHRLWTGVLVGMLALPCLTTLLPAIVFPVTILPSWAHRPAEVNPAGFGGAKRQDPDANTVEMPLSGSSGRGISQAMADNGGSLRDFDPAGASAFEMRQRSLDFAAFHPGLQDAKEPSELRTGQSSVGGEGSIVGADLESEQPFASVVNSWWWMGLLAAWSLGAGVFAIRLVVGLVLTSRLVARSRELSHEMLARTVSELPESLQRMGVEIRCNEALTVPVTVGWLNPKVLLPRGWETWNRAKLRVVLIHELTHVARRDFGVSLLAEFNRCLYWFHPVSWWLRQRLSQLAEESCDDAAVRFTGDPTAYARHLLEVAAGLTARGARVASPGLSMARDKNVETRIKAILDFTRPLSQHLSWRAGLMLLAMAVPIVGIAAALHPQIQGADSVDSDESGVPETNADVNSPDTAATADKRGDTRSTNPEPATEVKLETEGEQQITVQGNVTDGDGNVVDDAKVYVLRPMPREWYAAIPRYQTVAEIPLSDDGHFKQTFLRSQLLDPPDDPNPEWRAQATVIVVVAPGYARTVEEVRDPAIADKKAMSIRLHRSVTITGTLLGPEGQPIKDAEIVVRGQIRCQKKSLDDWLARASRDPLNDDERGGMRSMTAPPPKESLFPREIDLTASGGLVTPVHSDSSGKFQVPGVGPDDMVLIDVSAPGIAKMTLHVLGRDCETVYARHASHISRVGAYHGRQFQVVAEPGAPVFGTVYDGESKTPLADVTVAIGGMYGKTMSHSGYVVTKTDSQGNYRIEGFPTVPQGTRRFRRNRVSVRPGSLPYIETDFIPVPLAKDELEPIKLDIDLRRAVMAHGRVINQQTGQPVQAKLWYTPMSSNSHGTDYRRYRDSTRTMLGNDSRYHTDADGKFRIPVIPGRGVLMAKCDSGDYLPSHGLSDIPEFQSHSKGELMNLTSDHCIPSMQHALVALDVPTDVMEHEVDVPVMKGMSLTIRYVDPEGQPLTGQWASGLDSRDRGRKLEQSHATATGLTVGEVRAFYAQHPERDLYRFARLVPQKGQTEFVIRLMRPTTIQGRLIDPEGKPLPGVAIDAKHQNNPSYSQSAGQAQQTDNQGKFQYHLPVGTSYSLLGHGEKVFHILKDFSVERSQLVDLGDLVVDPDGEDWDMVEAKHDPVIQELDAQTGQREPSNEVSQINQKEEDRGDDSAGLLFAGRVLDTKGKPVSKAKVFLLNGREKQDGLRSPEALTESDGKFRFRWHPKVDGNWTSAAGKLLAVVDGEGFGSTRAVACERTGRLLDALSPTQRMYLEYELQASVDEVPNEIVVARARSVRGRIVDSEGHPVVGATLKPTRVEEARAGSLDDWLQSANHEKADYYSTRKHLRTVLHGHQPRLVIPATRTDKEGWFELKGLAKHQIAELLLEGPGIQTSQFNLRGDDGESIDLPSSWDHKALETYRYYTDGFTHLVGPSQSLTGKLVDHETRQPIANCLIQAERISTQRIGGRLSVGYIQTRSDENGAFHLSGLPLGECEVVVVPEPDTAYVAVTRKVSGKEPGAVTRQDIPLIRGTIVEGTAADATTGNPIQGEVQYVMFGTNLHVSGEQRYRLSKLRSHYRTDSQGRFQIPVLAGPGLILFMADEHRDYARGGGRDALDGPWSGKSLLDTRPTFETPNNYHYVSQVDPEQGTEKISLPIRLTSGETLEGKVVGTNGEVLRNYKVFGTTVPGGWYLHRKPELQVHGFRRDRPQRIIAWDPDSNAAGSVLLNDESGSSMEIKLRPAGTLVGQLVDKQGAPVAGVQLINAHRVNHSWGDEKVDPQTRGKFPDDGESKRQWVTDESGHFRIEGLAGGLSYSARALQLDDSGEQAMRMGLGDVFKDVVVDAGETKDLGRVVLKRH